MADITVSTDIDTFLQSADNTAARDSLGVINITTQQSADITTNNAKVGITPTQAADIVVNNAKEVRTDANGAFSAGDLGGNARGTNAINIQASRSAVTQVASGPNALAIGNSTTASGNASTASGYYATASGSYSTAVGYYATASGSYSTAVGYTSVALGDASTASGYYSSASGDYSTAVGAYAKTTVNNTTEIGFWSSGTVRAGAIRVHSTGQVALTTPTTDTAYLPSTLAKGSEINGTLAQGMFATRIGSTDNELITEVNRAGTIATFSAPRIDSNGAVSIGDLGGNARGANAINIQAARGIVTEVASGSSAIAIGNNASASGDYSTALGYYSLASGAYSSASGPNSIASGGSSTASGSGATASGSYSTASGYIATASGYYSTASGYYAYATAENSTAVGARSRAAGVDSTAIGKSAKTTVANTTEIGTWSGYATRAGAVRVHSTGMVAQTIQNRSTAYGDGGATKGSEADNTVIREGIALRRNGNEILVDLNIGGTVTTLSLGTAS